MGSGLVGRSIRIAVLGTAVLIAATVVPVLAKGPPGPPPGSSFSVSVCVAGDDGEDLRISVSWSRIAADGVSFGFGDGTGQGAGIFEPLGGVTRSSSMSLTFVGNAHMAEVAGATLHLKQAVMASHTETRPASGWPAC